MRPVYPLGRSLPKGSEHVLQEGFFGTGPPVRLAEPVASGSRLVGEAPICPPLPTLLLLPSLDFKRKRLEDRAENVSQHVSSLLLLLLLWLPFLNLGWGGERVAHRGGGQWCTGGKWWHVSQASCLGGGAAVIPSPVVPPPSPLAFPLKAK